jgi:hypothetical protein
MHFMVNWTTGMKLQMQQNLQQHISMSPGCMFQRSYHTEQAKKVLVMEWLSGDCPFDVQSVAQGMQLPDATVTTWEQQQEAKHCLLNMVGS